MADISIFEISADISICVIFYSLHQCRHCLLKSSIGQAPLLFTSLKSYLQQLLFLIKCSGESGIQMLNCKNWQLHQKLPIESLSHPTFSVKLGQCFPKVCVPKVAPMSLFCFHTFASRDHLDHWDHVPSPLQISLVQQQLNCQDQSELGWWSSGSWQTLSATVCWIIQIKSVHKRSVAIYRAIRPVLS